MGKQVTVERTPIVKIDNETLGYTIIETTVIETPVRCSLADLVGEKVIVEQMIANNITNKSISVEQYNTTITKLNTDLDEVNAKISEAEALGIKEMDSP